VHALLGDVDRSQHYFTGNFFEYQIDIHLLRQLNYFVEPILQLPDIVHMLSVFLHWLHKTLLAKLKLESSCLFENNMNLFT